MIEFGIENGLSIEEAIDCINAEPPMHDDIKNPFHSMKKRQYLRLTKEQLLNLDKNQVFICQNLPPIKTRFYINIITEINLSKCPSCNKVCFRILLHL